MTLRTLILLSLFTSSAFANEPQLTPTKSGMFDVGGFSLNYHKHIHTGEGGIVVTNDDQIAERLQLIRNHAEVVVNDKGVKNITNI